MKYIEAYALQNALEFGRADAGKILPKLFQHGLEKSDISGVMISVKKIVDFVNGLSAGERKKMFSSVESLIHKEEKKEGELPELEGAVVGKVVTRLAPEPSKYNHIGHALVFLIQYFYAKKYNGKCILRIEDTNPEKSTDEYHKSMLEDLKWIGLKWDKEIIVSNEMQTFYNCAEQLILQDDAYVCSCNQEKMKELREQRVGCECREKSSDTNFSEWKKMLAGEYDEGEVTVRLKANMESDNGVMRDPVIFRISYAEHFLQKKKYCVWPTYDFENPIADSINEVTHVIRSNEFEQREELHKFILDRLGMKGPIVREIGRYRIAGAETQGRIIREMIMGGKFIGWDDPRLVTIKALRRRGFVPEMFQELAKVVGLSKSSGQIDFAVLDSINRKLIDPTTKRYFFVSDAVKIKINGAPKLSVNAPLHPSDSSMGVRKLSTSEEFYVAKEDLEILKKEKNIRFMHLFNFSTGKEFTFLSKEVNEKLKVKFIHWLPVSENLVDVEVLMPDASVLKGLAEPDVRNVKVGEVVQFERFGFCKLDSKTDKKMHFWFTHK